MYGFASGINRDGEKALSGRRRFRHGGSRMTTSDGAEKCEMPSRHYSYSPYDILLKIHEIEIRLARMEKQQISEQEEVLTNHLFSYGGFLIALGLAAYALSFELPSSHFAPISLLVGIIGIAMLITSLFRLRRVTRALCHECGKRP